MSNRSGSKALIHDCENVRRKERDGGRAAGAPPARRQPDPESGLHCAVFSNHDGGLGHYLLARSLDFDEAALAATPPDHGCLRCSSKAFSEQTGHTQPPRPGGEHVVFERGHLGGQGHTHSARLGKGVTLNVVHM